MKGFFKYWGWEDNWATLALVAAICLVGLFLTAIGADHTVRSYYLEASGGPRTCVKADEDWKPDEPAFCSDDVNKSLEVLKQLQAQLPPRSR